MAKTVVTISISVPKNTVELIDKVSKDMNISRSSLITAILSGSMKWDKKEGGVKYGI